MSLKSYIQNLVEQAVKAKLNEISPLNNTKNQSDTGLAKIKSVDSITNKATVQLTDGTEKTGVTIATSRPVGPNVVGFIIGDVYTST